MKSDGMTPYPTDESEEGWENIHMLEKKYFDSIEEIDDFVFEYEGDKICGILRRVETRGPWRVFVIQSKKYGYVKICTRDYPMLRSALAYIDEGFLVSIEYEETYEFDDGETMIHFDIKYIKSRELIMDELSRLGV